MLASPSSRPKKDLYSLPKVKEICAGNAGDQVTRTSHCWHRSPGSWVNFWDIQHAQMFGAPAPQTIDDTI
ncbi:hypothetical protein BDV33DRAFT_196682 [Aspergillus novoparasiticus]|uniref:Uncharacterized protein n=1 Tax=Aspergillus novoparasiticus TaxID=986946 RepID=A0A5N6E8Y2_9EURO|nr:hypothetical protein BDV33DRAFT_196682 [Aspergillus novoparasiticus]